MSVVNFKHRYFIFTIDSCFRSVDRFGMDDIYATSHSYEIAAQILEEYIVNVTGPHQKRAGHIFDTIKREII